MKGERRIDVDGEVWSFRIGRAFAVIVSPGGVKSRVDLSTMTGRDWNTLERGQWKRTRDGMVVPDHVRRYVRKHRDELTHVAAAARVDR